MAKITELTIKIKIPDWLEHLVVGFVLLYRRLRYGYAFRLIPLTQGKYAIVDPEDYHRLKKNKWYALQGPRTFYAVRSLTNGQTAPRKNAYMHHLVINIPPGRYCDHINRNGLDNRKANLRVATHTQNVWNRRKFKPYSRSRYKGIDWSKDMKRWRVRIRVNGKRIYLGSFKSETDAALEYDRAARKFHGEYASLNFPGLARKS